MNLVFKSVVSASIGNILEWYDYTLYAYFATIITVLFFPTGNYYTAILLTFVTFFVGLVARPIGGLIFGYIGDRYSRKRSLIVSVLLMSVPTLCIGLLPTYYSIGIFAPVLLVILRIVQGLALGGEFGSSCVYLYESVPINKRGFFGTLALTGVGLGLILSSCTVFVIEFFFSREQIISFAWRIPFLASSIGSFLGFYMRHKLIESRDFEKEKSKKGLIENPFTNLLLFHRKTVVFLFSIFLTTQIAFFVVFIFGKNIMIDYLGYNNSTANKINLLIVSNYTLSTLFAGYLSDRFNKKSLILIGIVGIFLCSFPFVYFLQNGSYKSISVISAILGAFIGLSESVLNPFVVELFPIKIRTTAVAFCWNFTSVIFGGSAPLIIMSLMKNYKNIYCVSMYLMAACLISITSLMIHYFRDSKNKSIVEVA